MPEDPILIPIHPADQTPEEPPAALKRKRGGQPGNKNALKHGLYIQGNFLYNLTPYERASLSDTRDIIEHFKTYMEHLYSLGIHSKDLEMVNITIRSYAAAAVALTRLLQSSHEHSSVLLPSSYRTRGNHNVTAQSFIRGAVNDLKHIVDLHELEGDLDDLDSRLKNLALPPDDPSLALSFSDDPE